MHLYWNPSVLRIRNSWFISRFTIKFSIVDRYSVLSKLISNPFLKHSSFSSPRVSLRSSSFRLVSLLLDLLGPSLFHIFYTILSDHTNKSLRYSFHTFSSLTLCDHFVRFLSSMKVKYIDLFASFGLSTRRLFCSSPILSCINFII